MKTGDEAWVQAVERAHNDFHVDLVTSTQDGVVSVIDAGCEMTRWRAVATYLGPFIASFGATYLVSVANPSTWTSAYVLPGPEAGALHSSYVVSKFRTNYMPEKVIEERPGEIYALTRMIAQLLGRPWHIDGLGHHPINLP